MSMTAIPCVLCLRLKPPLPRKQIPLTYDLLPSFVCTMSYIYFCSTTGFSFHFQVMKLKVREVLTNKIMEVPSLTWINTATEQNPWMKTREVRKKTVTKDSRKITEYIHPDWDSKVFTHSEILKSIQIPKIKPTFLSLFGSFYLACFGFKCST